MTLEIVLYAVMGATLQRLRGWVNYLVWVMGVVWGLAAWANTGNIYLSVVFCLAMVLGENWGWTKWIVNIPFHKNQEWYNLKWAYPKEVDSPGYEHVLAALIDDKSHYKTYVITGMALRGLLWWAPVYAVFYYFGLPLLMCVASALFLSVVFPMVYWLGYRLSSLGFRYLQRSEVMYGAIYGVVLLYALKGLS